MTSGANTRAGIPEMPANLHWGGTEWRTAPLWGLGLVQAVNPRAGFLHDGRARSIEEAILWHGHPASEARQAWEGFVALPESERNAVLRFLESQ